MKKQKGFTLVEVMVAVAILAIASVAVLRYFSQDIYALKRISSTTEYSFNLKFYFTEAIRRYSLPITAREYEGSDHIEFSDDEFIYSFDFLDADFVNEYPVKDLSVAAKKIRITVKRKLSGDVVYQGEGYHLFKRRKQ